MRNLTIRLRALTVEGRQLLPIGANVVLTPRDKNGQKRSQTDHRGYAIFEYLSDEEYNIEVDVEGQTLPIQDTKIPSHVSTHTVYAKLERVHLEFLEQDGTAFKPATEHLDVPQGKPARFRIRWGEANLKILRGYLSNQLSGSDRGQIPRTRSHELSLTTNSIDSFFVYGALIFKESEPPQFELDDRAIIADVLPAMPPKKQIVSLDRSASENKNSLALWPKIRFNTDALQFEHYLDFMEWLFCTEPLSTGNPLKDKDLQKRLSTQMKRTKLRRLPFADTDAYRNIKAATEAFVMVNCAFAGDIDTYLESDASYIIDRVRVELTSGDLWEMLGNYLDSNAINNGALLPYLAAIHKKMKDEKIKDQDIGDVPIDKLPPEQFVEGMNSCYGLLRSRLTQPCMLELIWSYWQEEGMLVQTMNAIARRFQNIRAPGQSDPLANLEVDPLRPLNNVLWGYIQDEQHRLSVVRRNYEYDHHYGLRLSGKAVNNIRSADSRSKFLEAFHTLLSIVARFYRLDDDETMNADAFPVLNALKEAHLILSQGAHNQYGDLPSTARIEMLMQQWILARPEFREFIPTRIMVAYPEPWMDRVDAMKKLQSWTDTSVLHFRNLAVFGEQALLSIRFGDWNAVHDPVEAKNWARYWRPEIQGYLHAYRSVTGIDLSVDVTNERIDATMPSVHLVKRLGEQRRTA